MKKVVWQLFEGTIFPSLLAMSEQVEEPEVMEPEVISPEGKESEGFFGRLEGAFGPIVAGMIIDAIDIATFGPFGIFVGMIVGGTAAYWMCSIYRLPIYQRFLWALAAGLYCTVPRTEFIPIATLIGAFARFVHGEKSA